MFEPSPREWDIIRDRRLAEARRQRLRPAWNVIHNVLSAVSAAVLVALAVAAVHPGW